VSADTLKSGTLFATGAYVLWGIFPLYLKMLASVPASEILAHRMTWSLVVCAALLAGLRRFRWLADVIRQPRLLAMFAVSALLVSANWGIYIWAVNSGRVVDASLGYFINPLLLVALGALALHERPRKLQWLAFALAAIGVLWLTWHAGSIPWIGLALAASFGLYGLIRKTASLGAIEGLTVETALLAPLALAYLVWLSSHGQNAFAQNTTLAWLLAGAGPVTAVPLLLFAAGARRISMTQLGMLQYISPTLQFVLGVWLYREPFGAGKAAGFGLIWIALALFTAEGLWQRRTGTAVAHESNVSRQS